jgi:hypothetical protein
MKQVILGNRPHRHGRNETAGDILLLRVFGAGEDRSAL